MELFKKRLKRVGSELLFWFVTLILAVLFTWGIFSIPLIVAKIIAGTLGGIIGLGFLIGLGYNIWQFIHWLFIEPFRRKK